MYKCSLEHALCIVRLNMKVVWDLCSTWEGRMLSIYSNTL